MPLTSSWVEKTEVLFHKVEDLKEDKICIDSLQNIILFQKRREALLKILFKIIWKQKWEGRKVNIVLSYIRITTIQLAMQLFHRYSTDSRITKLSMKHYFWGMKFNWNSFYVVNHGHKYLNCIQFMWQINFNPVNLKFIN